MLATKQIVWKKEENEWIIYKNLEKAKPSKTSDKKQQKNNAQLVKNFPQTQKRQKGNIIYCTQGYGILQDIDLTTKKVVVKANNEMLNFFLNEIFFEIPIQLKIFKDQSVQKEVGLQIPLYTTSEDLLNKISECMEDECDDPNAQITVQAFFNGKMILPTKQSLQTVGILPNSKILVICEASALDSVILKDRFELIYRASRDGFTGAAFHQACDNQERTLVICQEATTMAIFGGYANLAWSQSYQYKEDKDGFLYSLKTGKKYTLYRNHQYAYYHDPNYGPTFGGGHDLYISGTGQSCYTNLGYCYGSEEEGVKYSQETARTEICGIYQFNLKDYEVFKLK